MLAVLRELGGKITTAELKKVSTFGRINPRIRFLTQPGEYSDLLNKEFGAKFEVGEIERIKETLKKIVRNRQSAADTAKLAAKSVTEFNLFEAFTENNFPTGKFSRGFYFRGSV